MNSIDLQLDGSLSRRACAIVLKQIIKFVVYNNQQIPYTYEGFQQLIARKRKYFEKSDEKPVKSAPSFKQMKAKSYYEKIENVYNGFEKIFKSIEEELDEGRSLTEIVIVFGATLISPKHVYRVNIPELSNQQECDAKIRSHLFKVYRGIVGSSGGGQFADKCSGLTNIFILFHGDCKTSLGQGIFVPKFDFRIPTTVSQTLISFSNSVNVDSSVTQHSCNESAFPQCSGVTLLVDNLGDSCDSNQLKSNENKWYLAKQPMSGFHDFKIDGVSVFNVLSDVGS